MEKLFGALTTAVQTLAFGLLVLLPRRLVSRLFGKLASLDLPSWAISLLARMLGIDPTEAEKPFAQYPTFESLFTRRLQAGCRPVGQGLCSPVDGIYSGSKALAQGHLEALIKGHRFQAADLIGKKDLAPDRAAVASVFYLSPSHYHRVHAPLEASLLGIDYLPGDLWPVNSLGLRFVEGLFSGNERLVFTLAPRPDERLFLVMVGALNVGKMSSPFWPDLFTNPKEPSVRSQRTFEPGLPLAGGEELGIFHLGSTVVLLFEQKTIVREKLAIQGFGKGLEVKMGQPLASLVSLASLILAPWPW